MPDIFGALQAFQTSEALVSLAFTSKAKPATQALTAHWDLKVQPYLLAAASAFMDGLWTSLIAREEMKLMITVHKSLTHVKATSGMQLATLLNKFEQVQEGGRHCTERFGGGRFR